MSDTPKRGRRVQVYIPADLLTRWDQLPRYERSAEVANALRAWWKIEPNVATNVANTTDSADPPQHNAE